MIKKTVVDHTKNKDMRKPFRPEVPKTKKTIRVMDDANNKNSSDIGHETSINHLPKVKYGTPIIFPNSIITLFKPK